MTSKQFRTTIMIILLIALVEIVVGIFYYFVFFTPYKQMETLQIAKDRILAEKKIEQDRILQETKLKEKTRMEEIKLEVKQIDAEQARIERWAGAGEEFDKLRQAEEAKKGKEASLTACMRIVVENYHSQWNLFCEQLNLPNSCALPDDYAQKINSDYEIGKKQCNDFFKQINN